MYENKGKADYGKSDRTHQLKGCQLRQQNSKAAKLDNSKRTFQMKADYPMSAIQRAGKELQSLTAVGAIQNQSTIGSSADSQLMLGEKAEVYQMRRRETKNPEYELTPEEEAMCETTGRDLSRQKHNHAGKGVHSVKYKAKKYDERNDERDAQQAIDMLKEQVLQRKETGNNYDNVN
ncbi:hypothetical protein EHE19_014265 [Ruminiclostridium herbifermentans]|uniref:Uncharacterized protein n=1 Tax=Ruminiclostridium herbifermentans TaxID=2488810 RepID=A0A4U7JH79_9FIRM|nr:hypothetical protein [Ruminiclostridium herbifermentans]QNU66038.1 hypothetical protein EHE19_014265 [Ruminiclostridium herbifermentans]